MLAVLHGFVAAGAATFLHEFVSTSRREALSRQMAYLLANVPAWQLLPAYLSTRVLRLTAVHVGHDLCSAVADFGYQLETGGTVALVALESTLVSTRLYLCTRTHAGRRRCATHDGWIGLSGATWTVKRLV